MNYDLLYIVGILVIPLAAQLWVMANYNKFKKQELAKRISGFEVARKILDENGLEKVHIVEIKGTLSDHYDPSRKVLRLSTDAFHGETVAAASIAAHEVGHAIQDKEGYVWMKIRSLIYPVVRIGTSLSYAVILIGFFTEILQWFYLGIGLVGLGLLFQLITLPVEFDASKRAEKCLKDLKFVSRDEEEGTRKVLGAAALTYVAGVLTSAMELVRLVLLFNSRRD